MKAIAHWLNKVSDPSNVYDFNEHIGSEKDDFKKGILESVSSIRAKYVAGCDDSSLRDQLQLADDMPPIEAFQYTCDLIRPYILSLYDQSNRYKK